MDDSMKNSNFVMGLIFLVSLLGTNSITAQPNELKTKTTSAFKDSDCPTSLQSVPAMKNARCGFLSVPENRNNPNSRTIQLAVAIIPALSKSPAPDPIVYMVGGPGGSALPAAQMLVDAGLNQERNLILMDQRGTFFSKPALLCPEVDRARARAVALPYDSNVSEHIHIEATSDCYKRLSEKGIDLSAYNTTENTADFSDLRKALGISQWNVYGVSYGTDLALSYMRNYPEGIRSVTIDSVLPPHLVNLGIFWTSSSIGLNNVFQACDNQPLCKKNYPNIKETFNQLVSQLEKKAIVGRTKPILMPGSPPAPDAKETEVVLDGGALINWAIGATEVMGSKLPAMINQLAKGKAQDVLASYAATGISHEGEFSYGLMNSIVCSEWVADEPKDTIMKAGRQAFPTFPPSVLAQSPQFPFMHGDCRVWPVSKAPATQRNSAKASIPTLVISGSYDAITAPFFAEAAAKALPHSTFVTIPGVGHFVVPKSLCAQQIMASFIKNPDQPDIRCLSKLKEPPFQVNDTETKSQQ